MRNGRTIASVAVLGVALAGAPTLLATADGGSAPPVGSKPDASTPTQARPLTALEELSPGDRIIAVTLYQAQTPDAGADKALSLEHIAAMRHDGQSWLDVFGDMKSRGLVQERNLGRLIARQSSRRSPEQMMKLARPGRNGSGYIEAGLKKRDGNAATGVATAEAANDTAAKTGVTNAVATAPAGKQATPMN